MNIQEVIGWESFAKLKDFLPSGKILMVTGRASFESCGAKAFVENDLSKFDILFFNDFEVNPKIEDGLKGARLAAEADIDMIVAVGGGSVMDMAKLIKAILSNPDGAEEIVRGDIDVSPISLPFIAIPTTAGSGSEATQFAVVYIGKQKFSLSSSYLLPDITILDGQLIQSNNAYQRAVNGLDALAQAIESCWAVSSTEDSYQYSLDSIEKLWPLLPKAVGSSDEYVFQDLLEASNLAGKAINITRTTAPHAFSYGFTSYHGVAHGHAVWLTLPEVFQIHCEAKKEQVIDPRGYEHLETVMSDIGRRIGVSDLLQSGSYLRQYVEGLGIETDMRSIGVKTSEDRKFLSAQVNLQRLANNPVAITDSEIRRIFDL